MRHSTLLILVLLAVFSPAALACTNLLVTKGASTDGSVYITYTCDGIYHPQLGLTAAADHGPDEWVEFKDGAGKLRGRIKQVPHTYAILGLMNEHQVTIGESTFDGREELINPDALLYYPELMRLALERAQTAREAVQVFTSLAMEHGYNSPGESIAIGDANEAWLLEIVGTGKGGQGAVWVALRVPDGCISAFANKSRIGEFPLNDPDNCLYSPNVIAFAEEKGYYKRDSGRPFRFCDAYCPETTKLRRICDSRIYSFFHRAAPSLGLTVDYCRGATDAQPYPLWIKPDHKLSTADVFALMRDHYEGTPMDMTQGLDAGPFNAPMHVRPLGFTVDGVDYVWERPISTQQTGFVFISQSRAWLPDLVGGVFWYGHDDTYLNCFTPLYCGINAIPPSFAAGSLKQFTWDSAWWTFNFVSNFANLRYSDMVKDIQAVQRDLEGNFLALQPAVEQTAATLAKTDPKLAVRYLTDYCVTHGELVTKRWRALGEHLLTKYNDGFIQDQPGNPQEIAYPEAWLRKVIQARPDQFRLAPSSEKPK